MIISVMFCLPAAAPVLLLLFEVRVQNFTLFFSGPPDVHSPAAAPVLLLLFDVVDDGGAQRVRQLLRVQVFDLTVPMRQRL